MSEIKNCGNCRWFEIHKFSETVGNCTQPLPSNAGWLKSATLITDGTDCPCFALPIPREVVEAAKRHKESSLPCDSEAHEVAAWAIDNIPELRGEK